jgi:regulator of sirC expression with transglutaminase-like and TPR domain
VVKKNRCGYPDPLLSFFILFMFYFSLLLLIFFGSLEAASSTKTRALYNSLDQTSVSQHLALYELYPDSIEGEKALQHAWSLLAGNDHIAPPKLTELPSFNQVIHGIIALVNKQPNQQAPTLNDTELGVIDLVAERLPHRKLRGHWVTREEDVLNLPPEEIDLARGLLLSQWNGENNILNKIKSYEAALDLMALQILCRLPTNPSPEEKIRAINHFIFEEMGYRFPPHSLYAKDIDLYTFLPSVLDSRRGVCLGVSILYICLAQRLTLPLEMVTPPGHIYVRYHSGDKTINIETTARGIHLDSEEYLGIDTRSLQLRNIKEVIGLAHFNEASVYWQQQKHEKALAAYQKALPYLTHDMLLKELMGYNYIVLAKKEEGEELLKAVQHYIPDYAVSGATVASDYLQGNVDGEGIKILFMHVDETRKSILEKKEALEKILKKHPTFREGQLSLAIAWLQLHREGEALDVLKNLHSLDPRNPEVEYYLAALYDQRLDYNQAWEHLRQAEALVKQRNHKPKALKELRRELTAHCPE